MTRSTSPLLEAVNLVRIDTRTGKYLLNDASLAIRPGDRLAIVGPTGAGKSVLLRALCLLDTAQSGELRWQGEKLDGGVIPLFRSQVIYLAQRPAMFDGTVEQNLRQPLELKTHSELEFRRDLLVEWLASLNQPPEFLEKSANDLSGGEQQIVGLLRALQLDPQVLLLDEPTASLDQETTHAVERLVGDWAVSVGKDRSVAWVSHDPQQAERVSTHKIHLEAGRIRTDK